jgi:hypothetical protein
MWLLWLPRNEANPDQTHNGAWCDNPLNHALLCSEIQREIWRRLAPIGADPEGTDAVTVVPVERLFHTGAEKYVR